MFASRCINGLRIPCVVFYIVVVIAIFAYGFYVRSSGRPDVLEKSMTASPSVQNLDGWAMTHFFFWMFLGFWYPGKYLQAMGFSLAWEGIEDLLGRTNVTMGGSRLQLVGETVDGEVDENTGKQYWYGRYTTDTAYNLMGYILGSTLAKRFWPEDACKCSRCRATPEKCV